MPVLGFMAILLPGTRTFGGIHVAGIQVCGVLACTNYSPDLKDCVPIPGNRTTLPRFELLKLEGKFSLGKRPAPIKTYSANVQLTSTCLLVVGNESPALIVGVGL